MVFSWKLSSPQVWSLVGLRKDGKDVESRMRKERQWNANREVLWVKYEKFVVQEIRVLAQGLRLTFGFMGKTIQP